MDQNAYQGSWRDKLCQSVNTADALETYVSLTESERAAFKHGDLYPPFSVTPHYLSLIDPDEPEDPLRKMVVPRMDEFDVQEGEFRDPLGEDRHEPVPGLVHTYPDKVLFLVTDACAGYCRYCTRSRRAGRSSDVCKKQWDIAVEYIQKNKDIRDVLLSGGDPLILDTDVLGTLLTQIRAINHVELLRIGTRVPVFLPQRMTDNLVNMLKSVSPLWITLHVSHPRELTPEFYEACNRLADAGIVLGCQTVLLKGVNDRPEIMRELLNGLLRARVRPYYLHQCDAVEGCGHFRTSIERGQEIIRALHGHTSGYAVPTYVVDAPGGGGKIPVTPSYVVTRKGREWQLKNFEGKTYRYVEGND